MAVSRHGNAAAPRGLEQPDGHQRVAHLVLAAQRERQRPVAVLGRLDRHGAAVDIASGHARVGARVDEAGALFAGDAFDDRARLVGQRADDDLHAGLDDPGLLERNRLEGVAEVLLVVEPDRRDRAATGTMTFVESKRPPRPTSITATSTPARRNSSNAIAVVASKNVGWTGRLPVASSRSAQSSTSSAASWSASGVDGRVSDDEALRRDRRGEGRCSGPRGRRPRRARRAPSPSPIPCRWCRRHGAT